MVNADELWLESSFWCLITDQFRFDEREHCVTSVLRLDIQWAWATEFKLMKSSTNEYSTSLIMSLKLQIISGLFVFYQYIEFFESL